MTHDPTKVLLGATQSSEKDISCEPADPATFVAGLAVRRTSGGGLAVNSGAPIGISLGRSLSDTAKTAVARTGLRVPLRLTDEGAFASIKKGDVTFTAKAKGLAGNSITVAFVDDGEAGEETVEVVGTDIVIHGHEQAEAEPGTTAGLIVAAIEASEAASALIGAVADEGDEDVEQDAFAEDALENGLDSFPYAAVGVPVEITSTGLAVSSDTATGGVFSSGPMKGVDPITSVEYDVALVDMPGGL